LVLFLYKNNSSFALTDIICCSAIYACQYYAYLGILNKATLASTSLAATTAAASKKQNNKNDDDALVGGGYLDILGFLLVIQLLSTFWSRKAYWLLFVLPIAGGYTLYRTFVPASTRTISSNKPIPQSTTSAMESQSSAANKREKRAEKRRQKWS
jgi:hypothetical protein